MYFTSLLFRAVFFNVPYIDPDLFRGQPHIKSTPKGGFFL